MIDKPATYEADKQPLDTTVDALDSVDSTPGSVERKAGGGRFALFLAILSLSFTTIGVAAGYKHWQRMNDKARNNAAEIEQLRQQLQSVPAADALDALRKELQDKTAKLNTDNSQSQQEVARMLNETRQFADTVASQVEQVTFLQAKAQQGAAASASSQEWQVEEVAFLLQLANRQLHLAQDVRTAIAALKEADGLLAEAGSVAYLPVRQQIARDISTLEAVATPDLAGASQRINALMLGLKPLPAVDTASDNSQQVKLGAEADAPAEDYSVLSDYKHKFMQALDDAVVIRQHDKPIQMALDAATRQNLFQLLRLRLENLRLLLLQRDTAGFRAQLELIREAVGSYYPEAQAKPLLAELESFSKLELQPVLPDISASLKQLDSARQAETGVDAGKPPPAAEDKQDEADKKAAKEDNAGKNDKAAAVDKGDSKKEGGKQQ